MTIAEWIDSGPQRSEPRTPPEGQDRRAPPPAGAAIGVAGGVTVGAGIYLWWRAPASSTPTVGITSSGGIVAGWAAAF